VRLGEFTCGLSALEDDPEGVMLGNFWTQR